VVKIYRAAENDNEVASINLILSKIENKDEKRKNVR